MKEHPIAAAQSKAKADAMMRKLRLLFIMN